MKNLDYNKPQFTVQYVSFEGLKDYTIVYPHGNKELLVCAKYLKKFFCKKDSVTLSVKSDVAACTEKEILIGDTNRYKTALSEQEFAVSVQESRLIFEGGHPVMVEKAVKWFMTLDRRVSEMATLQGKAEEFRSAVTINGERYDYVWGDEFDGNFFDRTKFCQRSHMPNRSKNICVLSGDHNATLKVEDGLMKMSAVNYTDENNSELKYAIPECICTDDTMWWRFGYAEIRAKVPMKKGSWPAWWATSHCDSMWGKTEDWKYLVEIDFFEVFSDKTHIVPNIHKWYQNYAGVFGEFTDEKGGVIRGSCYHGLKLPNTHYEIPEEENEGYHTFGFKWTPEEMVMSVDGVEYMRYDLSFNFDQLTDMSEFVKRPLHMIFDNWVNAPGGWNAGDGKRWTSPELLPAEFFVEYVRLYQKPGEGYVINSGVDKEI